MSGVGNMNIMSEEDRVAQYKAHSHREHIYKICDTYIGSTENLTDITWKVEGEKMVQKTMTYIPGLYKLVDELIVNAWDQFIRCKTKKLTKVTYINIDVNPDSGIVTIENDGKGIDILWHPEHSMYTVEMIFAKLLTSTNYNEDEERITGGKNGYGAKLVNIFSKWFEVETVDTNTKKKYYQKFEDNMQVISKPIIENGYKGKEFTRVSFLPDFERFKISGWTPDMISIFERRAYEIAACSGNIKVMFNDMVVPIKRFKEFSGMFLDSEKMVAETCGSRWEVVAAVCDEFKSVSFVNGIHTSKGGKHVDAVVQCICKRMVEIISKKEKITVKPSYVREHLFVIINSIIVNPSFDSQTKDYLTTPYSKFGSKFELTDRFYDSLIKIGLIDKVIETYQHKESKQIKKTDGKKKARIYGIPKLDDANEAGGKKSKDCTLILTEGDSAKAMAVAGLSVVGRDLYGVFPLRGKVINAREKITTKSGREQVMNNTELIHMKQILGLEQEAKYTDTSKLRYGHIMIMTDQDYDGSHIKGLIINWLDTFWPELLMINGFVQCMQTPIVKTFHKKTENLFYSLHKYEEWKVANSDTKGWKTKYYKGLGTSTTSEAKEYFKNMMKQVYTWESTSPNEIDMAFNKERSDDRKKWIKSHDSTNILDESENIPYGDFINKELIHYSDYNVHRSVPHIMDGLKPSQRKILYACFKRKLKSEIRVAQLAGYVSEHSGYHHGEESLNKAIIAMAQNFVGSNNIHLLEPNGQFGTRLLGGKDAGSPRYLHTLLSDISYKVFNVNDEPLLDYTDDDGIPVEPTFYTPVIPFILCNGCQGIGTGYSTYIPSYDPKELIQLIKSKLNGKTHHTLLPYFNGFTGKVINLADNKGVLTKGVYQIMNYKTILISELPIGTSFDSFKTFIDEVVADIAIVNKGKSDKNGQKKSLKTEFKGVKNYKSQSTESKAHFEIEIDPQILSNWLQKAAQEKHSGEMVDNIEKRFRLTSKFSSSNMHLYSTDNCIKKYNNYEEIVDEFYDFRIKFYDKRKEYLLQKLQKEMNILKNKVKFIKMIVSSELIPQDHDEDELIEILSQNNFDKDNSDTYNYLILMPITRVTKNKAAQLESDYNAKLSEYNQIQNTTVKEMWLEDLDDLESSVNKHMEIDIPKNSNKNDTKRGKLKQTDKINKERRRTATKK